MPIPSPTQPLRPTRLLTEFTRGRGAFKPDSSPLHILPSNGAPLPIGPVLAGADTESATVTVGSLGAGASTALSSVIPLYALPKIIVDSGSTLVAQVSIDVSPPANGLTVTGSSYLVTALRQGGAAVSGPVFGGGSAYSGWGGSLQLTVWALAAIAVPSVINVTVTVQLFVYPKQLAAMLNTSNGGLPIAVNGPGNNQGGGGSGNTPNTPPGGGGGSGRIIK